MGFHFRNHTVALYTRVLLCIQRAIFLWLSTQYVATPLTPAASMKDLFLNLYNLG